METTELRTAAANRARMRASEEKFAARLRERGWMCFPPGTHVDYVAEQIFKALCSCPDEEA